jgi:hypothetical protein
MGKTPSVMRRHVVVFIDKDKRGSASKVWVVGESISKILAHMSHPTIHQ